MYHRPPPAIALEWPLGLVMDVCLKVGLGKSDSETDSWTESEISEHLAISQIRHWYEQPPGMSSESLVRFTQLVTSGEAYSQEWATLISHAASRKGKRSADRRRYFGISRFGKTSGRDVILPKLAGMRTITLAGIEKSLALPSPPFEKGPRSIKSSTAIKYILVFFVALAAIVVAKSVQKHHEGEGFGTVFGEIRFCSNENFAYLPHNQCKSDQRVFTTTHKKIYLSFEAITEVEPGTKFRLQWLRNGEVQIERERPWRQAFAFDHRYASTHIKMQKYENLPKGWAEPGRYYVRFFINDAFVDEAKFDIVSTDPLGL
ncbi:hypothetical protein [Arenicella xantha]|uniref:Uncharacterized protein n=1 Tax=Arenicella xantha TaxID=644221 RepID=A0A395JLR7_9GAMM|nr:hypothetical protein [Arenicella xantha]RBP50608.1 hypothetical protein DFR28_10219 [Arenicella xantha]